MLRLKIVGSLVVGGLLYASAASGKPETGVTKGNAEAAAAFDRLKQLAGDWEMANHAADNGKTAVRYRVTAGGSAVVETLFPEAEHEMVTVYHRDGDQLVLTHYCSLGNQPHARAKLGGDKDEIAFEFAGGCSLNPEKDVHMHSFRVRFVDADHLHIEGQAYANGKPREVHALDLVRKK